MMCKWNKRGDNSLTVKAYAWVKTAAIFGIMFNTW